MGYVRNLGDRPYFKRIASERGAIIRYLRFLLTIMGLILVVSCGQDVYADIGSADVFEGAKWEYTHEASSINKAWVQSSCVTDKYIVCFQNGSSKKSTPDSLIAFYKTDRDENGNEVPKYSYAKHVTEMDYEHGNGMTYNPHTNEIYIAAGPLLNPENSGNIYVVDGDTLMYKRTIRVGDGSHNFDFVAYIEDTNQYALQADGNEGHLLYIADENFNLIDTIPDSFRPEGWYLQDLCISGDYILGVIHNSEKKDENSILVYSISGRCYVGDYPIYLSGGESTLEAESIAEISPGVFTVIVGVKSPKRLRFYEAKVPAIFRVSTQVSNGTITESTEQAPEGEDYVVEFQPENNFELTDLTVDGETVEFQPDQASYTFKEIAGDHSIEAVFGEIPKYNIETKVENGTITESSSIYRDRAYKVQYTPDTHYELDQILIDGEAIDAKGFENGYEFTDIQTNHTIEVKFKEIPSWQITTLVSNGTISETITKAYRDSNHTISYLPDEDYMLFSVKIDGEKVDKKEYAEEASFHNVQGEHSIEVVYIWKYLPAVIALCAFIVALLVAFGIRLRMKRKKSRRKK